MTEKLSQIMGLNKTLELGDRGTWFEISNDDAAKAAEKLTYTAIRHYYEKEATVEEGHPRRWFVLVTEDNGVERGSVCLVVTPDGVELKDPDFIPSGSHVTGYQNGIPYPDFEFEISELSDAIGIDIEPNHMGRSLR